MDARGSGGESSRVEESVGGVVDEDALVGVVDRENTNDSHGWPK